MNSSPSNLDEEGVEHLVCSEGAQAASSKIIFYKLQLSDMLGLLIPQLEMCVHSFYFEAEVHAEKLTNLKTAFRKVQNSLRCGLCSNSFCSCHLGFIFVYVGNMSSTYFFNG